MRTLLEKSKSLGEVVRELFGVELDGRLILPKGSIEGGVAKAYNQIGLTVRQETYKKIVEDFKNRTGCYAVNHPDFNIGKIIDVGCGSGILSLELAEQTLGKIMGIDVSEDMIQLAEENKLQRLSELIKGAKTFQKRLPDYCQRKENFIFNLPSFFVDSVYDLEYQNEIDYIICRNTLHRLPDPSAAIIKMYEALSPNGKLYIRDLRRDAYWPTVVKRIGEERWKHPELVNDYVKAMAAMLTVEEIRNILEELKIRNYQITSGDYRLIKQTGKTQGMKEYEEEVEYVCVIKKRD